MPVAFAAARRSRRRPTGGWIGAGSSRSGDALQAYLDERRSLARKAAPDDSEHAFGARRRLRRARELHERHRGSRLRPRRWRRLLRLRGVPSDHAGSGASRQYRRALRSERRLHHSRLRSNVRHRHRERRRRQLRDLERRRGDWNRFSRRKSTSPFPSRSRRREPVPLGSTPAAAARSRRRAG